MLRSAERIVTTHTGSLPRPPDLVEMIWSRLDGEPVEEGALAERIETATGEVVAKQREAGIDLVSDGEMSKTGFSNYIYDRYSGFDGRAELVAEDLAEFPELVGKLFGNPAGAHIVIKRCVGPIELEDPDAVHRDVAILRGAVGNRVDGAFICAPSPGQITFNNPNEHYPSHEAYLEAVADAMRHEYQAITDAGFDVQLDSPDLAMAAHCQYLGSDVGDWSSHVGPAVEALNRALDGIPPERVRLHICWGNYPGPHHRDLPLREVIEPAFAANVGAISFEAANPRHEHEWEVFEELELPDDKVIIPGVIDVATNHIEHPRLVAQRLVRFANLVGRERVIGGTDCGFGTFAGWGLADPSLAWAKLAALAQGAELASEQLYGG